MEKKELLLKEILAACTDRSFLLSVQSSKHEILSRLDTFELLASELLSYSSQGGRISSVDILSTSSRHIDEMANAPAEGWAVHCYKYILNRIFPHLEGPHDADAYAHGRLYALAILRAVFSYERKTCRFDPQLDFPLISDAEVHSEGFTPEYIRMRRLAHANYIYEFMRIGSETTPFNTLGHIAGVHYVAVYMAKQLHAAGVPVDVALVSGAAASHDIGKYGCRKSEERRVPYLHYYYTDYCMTRNGMPEIAHIAANHSTWDLEFENLSAESLLLIYADFRVKSTRDRSGREIIHFYTLADAFDVILSKLDNVDEAKKHRYERVYARLRDFEDYMTDLGADTSLPDVFGLEDGVITGLPATGYAFREDLPLRASKELSLTYGDSIIDELKLKAVDHNIRLMHHFSRKDDFARLIETARSETDWKRLRTYITILGNYSTYMTEEQKSLTLKFLYDQLMHRESDIREQSARQMGQIVASFRQNYHKELPEDVPKLDETVTNLEMFRTYLSSIIHPSGKLTDQHRHWIIQSLDFYVSAVVTGCRPQFRERYFDILEGIFDITETDSFTVMSLLYTPLVLDSAICTDGFIRKASNFARKILKTYTDSIDLLALDVLEHFEGDPDHRIRRQRHEVLGITGRESFSGSDTDELLSSMFLDDLKYQIPWIHKIANIRYMMEVYDKASRNIRMHIATHFVNLIKISETVSVRKEAGQALLAIIPTMTLDQQNEIMIELYNGLEIEDYQFSRLIPDYLGFIMLHLPAEELYEVISNLEGNINSGNVKTASASLITLSIMLEHYESYRFDQTGQERLAMIRRITGLLIRGLAHYKDAISQEAFRTLTERVFQSNTASMDHKREILCLTGKRILTLVPDSAYEPSELSFYNSAASLNNIYRFISEFIAENGSFRIQSSRKIAFFPGTFDPFSLGHKAIACTIRNMGFEVYLALDEFSWSKKTLPHILRRKIVSMSIAGETDMYIFPDNIPVNIANPDDLSRLRDLFEDRDLYIAVGSDVIRNASSYKAKPSVNSIHSFNHIVFARAARKTENADTAAYPIRGDVINLTLRKYYEDISSTRIRENIDMGRDISNLIDPVVQSYIYDNNLYIRQPAYKHEIQARDLHISGYEHSNCDAVQAARDDLEKRGYDVPELMRYLRRPHVRTIYIGKSGAGGTDLCAFASARRVDRRDLLFEFGDTGITNHIRSNASGSIGVIGALYIGKSRNISNLGQILLTELLTSMLSKDYGYVIYHPVDKAGMSPSIIEALRRQGFVNISEDHNNPVYAVDMTAPVVIFRDVETVIKAPLNKNPRVMKAVDEAHNRLLRTFSEIYPGKLLLSFNTSAVYSKIVEMVAAENGVSTEPDPERRRGPYMAVPFGKALSDVVVPNTVTKALRTEKYINDNVREFTIRESAGYASLDDQIETLRSFNREVILIDDLLHSGQRMKHIDPMLRDHNIKVRKTIVGLLTGNARDDMTVSRRSVEGAYFIPMISMWLNERDCYPFIGGDSLDSGDGGRSSINLILPYTSYSFVGSRDSESVYKYSMTCLENARDILKVIEQEYQDMFEKQLTIGRLGAVITVPRRPDYGDDLLYDESAAPSVYIESDIKRARRLHLSRHHE